MRAGIYLVLILLSLSACNRNRGFNDGPDEFAVLPVRPLVMPPNLTSLPPPNSAAGNIADHAPRAEAIIALGGRP